MGIQTNVGNKELLEYRRLQEIEGEPRLSSLSYSIWVSQYSKMMDELDILFVFYNEEELNKETDFFVPSSSCRILMVPVNIFNEQNPFVHHIGYDSALNEVVNNILKVKDTAGSLIFTNKRLFLIKIPGKKTGIFLQEAALALQSDYLVDESSSEFQRVIMNLNEKYLEGHNYAFLLFNESVNETVIEEQISVELNVDFRMVMIEDAQCIGGKATVNDRLHALDLAEKMVQWTLADHHFDTVRLERNQQVKIYAVN